MAGRSQSPSTVQTNMLEGLQSALHKLTIHGNRVNDEVMKRSKLLASSSAAGGLCMVAVGLVPDLTLEAAKKAALGAGAKVVGSYGYELDEDTLDKIEASGCDMLLVVGGIDGGNKEVILHNAKMLAKTKLNVPFIFAGNRVVGDRVRNILEASGKYVETTANVLPELDRLDVEPARSCIRDVFMKRIVRAKGLDKAQEYVGDILMPTPMATLRAALLLAEGLDGEGGLGELMVVEIGGATTNIHSVATGRSVGSTAILKGIPEPYAKRTVEGDLGIRYNATTIVNIVGAQEVSRNSIMEEELSESEVKEAALFLNENVGSVPKSNRDLAIDVALARSAVEVAVGRHAGTIREDWGVEERIRVQQGKDLTGIRTLIGTGGIFVHNPYAEKVLEASLANSKNPFSLKPRSPDFYIDKDYMLYGIGLLSTVEPAIALRVGKKSLARVQR